MAFVKAIWLRWWILRSWANSIVWTIGWCNLRLLSFFCPLLSKLYGFLRVGLRRSWSNYNVIPLLILRFAHIFVLGNHHISPNLLQTISSNSMWHMRCCRQSIKRNPVGKFLSIDFLILFLVFRINFSFILLHINSIKSLRSQTWHIMVLTYFGIFCSVLIW